MPDPVGHSIFQSTKFRNFASHSRGSDRRASSPSWTTLYPNVLLMNLTFQTSLELPCQAARPVIVATPAGALLRPFFFLLGASQDTRRRELRARIHFRKFASPFNRGALTRVSRAPKSLAFTSDHFRNKTHTKRKRKR